MRRRILGLIAAGAVLSAGGVVLAPRSGDTQPPGVVALAELEAAIAAGGPVLVHVTAPWCFTCRRQKPIVAELLASAEFAGMTAFEVDFDSQKDLLARYRVTRQATMIVFKDGGELDRQTGQTSAGAIEALLRQGV